MTIPTENLDQIATFVPEDEDVAAEWVGVKRGLHNGSQGIKATAHIRHVGDQSGVRAGRLIMWTAQDPPAVIPVK